MTVKEVEEAEDDRTLGIRHRHEWQAVTARPRLQSAHDSMRWDVAKSRILSVNTCTLCDEFQRDSVQECTVEHCRAHPICERPYR
jgi:hypothetical protein